MRRYRDMFKGVVAANKHFGELFTKLGLQQISASVVELRWGGTIEGQAIEIRVTNGGKFEVTSTHIRFILPLDFSGSLVVGEFVPPLLRVGLTKLDTPLTNAYAYDIEWGLSVIDTGSFQEILGRPPTDQLMSIEPNKLSFTGQILEEDDNWVIEQTTLLCRLAKEAEALPPARLAPDSMIRRFAPIIALGLGVVVLVVFSVLFLLAIIVLT